MDCRTIMDFTNQNNAYMRHSGITITQVTPQQVTARAEIGPELLNPAGNLHGGVYFTMRTPRPAPSAAPTAAGM